MGMAFQKHSVSLGQLQGWECVALLRHCSVSICCKALYVAAPSGESSATAPRALAPSLHNRREHHRSLPEKSSLPVSGALQVLLVTAPISRTQSLLWSQHLNGMDTLTVKCRCSKATLQELLETNRITLSTCYRKLLPDVNTNVFLYCMSSTLVPLFPMDCLPPGAFQRNEGHLVAPQKIAKEDVLPQKIESSQSSKKARPLPSTPMTISALPW
ncbi:uncharacterized protein LOC116998424 [Catharus ustulatus]|uniref:uncharacterized protein LOC116998424 n=1 Tax=Catharus ustulatus TaxID=91951 RepID=UPI0014086E73|nr:uncharacterized protein LOC116998424 [Catharus ustulatus]XP_032919909.1 uncharacterized protein LOC116998424 [Catharus ustulatus]